MALEPVVKPGRAAIVDSSNLLCQPFVRLHFLLLNRWGAPHCSDCAAILVEARTVEVGKLLLQHVSNANHGIAPSNYLRAHMVAARTERRMRLCAAQRLGYLLNGYGLIAHCSLPLVVLKGFARLVQVDNSA